MINVKKVKRCCKDDISKIENYELAIADKNHVWECHHRLELTLDGEFAHTVEELERLGMYWHRPYFELIFLTKSEHKKLHRNTEEFKRKDSESHKGKKHSEETKQKISKALKGKKLSKETKQKMSKSRKGKSTLKRGKTYSEFGEKFKGHFGITRLNNIKLYKKEYSWYCRHNHKCRWE